MTYIVLVTFEMYKLHLNITTVTPHMRFDKKVTILGTNPRSPLREPVFSDKLAIGGIAAEAKMLQCNNTGRFKTHLKCTFLATCQKHNVSAVKNPA